MPQKNKSTPGVNAHVDHVYVVTVRTFKDRIRHIQREMALHHIKFSFFYEDFTPNLERDLIQKFNTDMPRGYKANVLQHIAMWREAVAKGYKRILVFEDDVILHRHFRQHFNALMPEVLQLKADSILFLGGSDTKVPEDFFMTKSLIYPLPIATSEGLLMDIAGIKRRLRYVDRHKIHLPIDHLIAHIDKVDHAQSFWSCSALTFQASIMGTLRTKFDRHRLKHSQTFNALRYYWHRFQRRQARAHLVRLKHALIRLITG